MARQQQHVDTLVEGLVIARFQRPDAIELLKREDRPDTSRLSTEAQTLRARADDLAESYAAGEITRQQLATASERIRADLDRVEAQLARAAERDPLAGIAGADDAADLWAGLDLGRRQAVIRALMTITLLPAGRGRLGRGFDPETVAVEWLVAD